MLFVKLRCHDLDHRSRARALLMDTLCGRELAGAVM
jgi:hypothetical protein